MENPSDLGKSSDLGKIHQKDLSHMLHGAGIFTNICPNKITQM